MRCDHRLLMDLRPQHFERFPETLELHELIRVGEVARDVLGRHASRCEVLILRPFLLRELLPKVFPKLEPFVDPWWPIPPEPDPDPIPWLHADMLGDAVLGGAVYALGAQLGEPGAEAAERLDRDDEWMDLLRPGAEVALREVSKAVERSGKRLDELREDLRGGS